LHTLVEHNGHISLLGNDSRFTVIKLDGDFQTVFLSDALFDCITSQRA
jgi:hypothetical protein